jgi:acyl-CoA synthetase (NDP forming)
MVRLRPPADSALSSLYDPASVAIVGASDDTRKWGNWLARGALRGAHRRAVTLVNSHGGTVLGRPAHRSLRELAEPIELAVIVVPQDAVDAAIDDALATGAGALVVITSFAGDVARRRALDARLAARAHAGGAVLLGPNCLGVFDASTQLELVPVGFPAGSIGFISQSGNLGLELGRLAEARGLGLSRFVSLGNQAGVDAATVFCSLLEHEPTRLIALYLEDLRNPEAIIQAAGAAAELGKPVLLMAPDRSDATARMAASHTASDPPPRAVIEGVCRAGGIERVADPSELIDAAADFLGRLPGPRARVGIVADGGGHAALATTLAERAGLEVPRLSEPLMAQLRAPLTATAAVENPIDLAGSGESDIRHFDRTGATIMRSGEVAGLLMAGCFGGYGDYSSEFAEAEVRGAQALAQAAADTGRALTIHSMYPESPAAEMLRGNGVFVSASIRRTVDRLAELLSSRSCPRRS